MSSGSESDEEYVPGEPEQLSEEDSDDEKTQHEHEHESKTNKRKIKDKQQSGKKTYLLNQSTEKKTPTIESKDVIKFEQQPSEEQKKKDDELWAKFLEGTDSKPKTKAELKLMPKEIDNLKTDTDITLSAPSNGTAKTGKDIIGDIKAKEARIFEFAGETLVVEGSVIKKTLPTTSNDPGVKDLHTVPKRSGGLSDLVGQLTKKSKLTTLEKSKLDWETFKQKEGIDEDLKTLNRGKDGYLERQEFLQRTDVRQYELEREVRMSRRTNR